MKAFCCNLASPPRQRPAKRGRREVNPMPLRPGLCRPGSFRRSPCLVAAIHPDQRVGGLVTASDDHKIGNLTARPARGICCTSHSWANGSRGREHRYGATLYIRSSGPETVLWCSEAEMTSLRHGRCRGRASSALTASRGVALLQRIVDGPAAEHRGHGDRACACGQKRHE